MCFSPAACFLDQVFTMQNPPLTPAKEMQSAMSEHPKEKAEESLRDEMQERTSQLTAKEKEVRKSLLGQQPCQGLRCLLGALRSIEKQHIKAPGGSQSCRLHLGSTTRIYSALFLF